ncbi:MAG: RluA family pseudouridine synthase [Tenericutes bacterium]|nr:RluA family pseudouridine synthase [Mycoplasmatota bacterium]
MEDGKVMSKLNVLYEDNHVIVVEKPINVLSQGDATGDKDLLTMVKEYVKIKYNKPGNVYIGLVHRLDRPVGGVMVFARSSKAASRLNKEQLEHGFSKKYLAVVNGILKEKHGQFVDKLLKLNDGNTIVSNKGKEAILNYEVLKENLSTKHSLVSVKLVTGRHHQIRVQFASRGHALCGDQRYGKQDNTQLALFAYELSFTHPISKEKMTFKLDMPKGDYWTEFTM